MNINACVVFIFGLMLIPSCSIKNEDYSSAEKFALNVLLNKVNDDIKDGSKNGGVEFRVTSLDPSGIKIKKVIEAKSYRIYSVMYFMTANKFYYCFFIKKNKNSQWESFPIGVYNFGGDTYSYTMKNRIQPLMDDEYKEYFPNISTETTSTHKSSLPSNND